MNKKIAIKDAMLSRLLRDGLVLPHDPKAGLVVLIRGKAGTGKSTLTLQLLDLIDSKAERCYFTLEQSTEDLRSKLASMWAARAIENARIPVYKGRQPHFRYDRQLLRKELASSIRAFSKNKAISRALTAVANVFPPLYDEAPPDISHSAKHAHEHLRDAVAQFIRPKNAPFVKPFNIQGINSAAGHIGSDGPLQVSQGRVVQATSFIDALVNRLKRRQSDRTSRPIVVLDGLSLLTGQDREAIELQGIVQRMRRHFQIGILVYEPHETEGTSLDHHADMVIELAEKTISQPASYLIHELCIRKARYQEAALGQHQFKIRNAGIAIFPSLHFQVQHPGFMDLELKRSSGTQGWKPALAQPSEPPCGAGSLIDMIFSPKPGESVVLLGSRNSFKTQLSLDFLSCGRWGCPAAKSNKEPGLLVSLIDNAPIIERGLSCPWHKSRQGLCWKAKQCKKPAQALVTHARAFCQRPGCITPAEFFHYLTERIARLQVFNGPATTLPRRVAFWDLTQMDYRFPLFREDKMLLPAMMDLFRSDKIKSLFMGAGNAQNTDAASAMADHVLFCWRSPSKSDRPNLGDSKSSLMLYVDRASASSNQSGKALYRIPVYQDDKLALPLFSRDLKKPEKEDGYSVNLSELMEQKYNDDKKQIDRITNMQGVA
jgi:KaiC/GvpD/RAD55 family RecA-like ATPase